MQDSTQPSRPENQDFKRAKNPEKAMFEQESKAENQLINSYYQANLEKMLDLLSSWEIGVNMSPEAIAIVKEYWEGLKVDLFTYNTTSEYKQALNNLPQEYMQFLKHQQVFVVDMQSGQAYYRQDTRSMSKEILHKPGNKIEESEEIKDEYNLVQIDLKGVLAYMTVQLIGDMLANIAMVKAIQQSFDELNPGLTVFTTAQTINETQFSLPDLNSFLDVVGEGSISQRKVQFYLQELAPAVKELFKLIIPAIHEGNVPGSLKYKYSLSGKTESLASAVVNIRGLSADDDTVRLQSTNIDELILDMKNDLDKIINPAEV